MHLFVIGAIPNRDTGQKPVEKRCKAKELAGAKRACIENYSVKQYDLIYVHEYVNGSLVRVWTKAYHSDWELHHHA